MEDNTTNNKVKLIRGDYELTEHENEQYEAICKDGSIDRSARKQTANLVRKFIKNNQRLLPIELQNSGVNPK